MLQVIAYLELIIYWSIAAIPFSVSFGKPGMANALIGIMSVHFVVKKILKRERLFFRTPLNLPFLLLIIVSGISFINSINYYSSFQGIIKWAKAGLIFLICAEEIKNKKHLQLVVGSIVAGALLASSDAVWQMFTGKDFLYGRPLMIYAANIKRATAGFSHTNILGVFLSAVTPLMACLSLYYFKGLKRLAIMAASALAMIGLFLTFSRGAVAALCTSIIFMAIVKKDKLILALLAAALVVMPFLLPKSIKDYAKAVRYNPVVLLLNNDRISCYRNALNMIKQHPVIGVGVNTFSINYGKYKLPEKGDFVTGTTFYAHNHFLQMGGEIGLLGLGVFLWFLFRIFKMSIRFYRNSKDRFINTVSLGTIFCLFAFLFNGLTETSLYYPKVSIIFWFLMGLALSVGNMPERENR